MRSNHSVTSQWAFHLTVLETGVTLPLHQFSCLLMNQIFFVTYIVSFTELFPRRRCSWCLMVLMKPSQKCLVHRINPVSLVNCRLMIAVQSSPHYHTSDDSGRPKPTSSQLATSWQLYANSNTSCQMQQSPKLFQACHVYKNSWR